MTEASTDLYTATRNRSYIESVRILIPQTWENVTANASTWENFQVLAKASRFDVIVVDVKSDTLNAPDVSLNTNEIFQDAEVQVDLPNWKFGDRPYTVQLGGCGDPGEYIHLTPNYVMNFDTASAESDFGPAGKFSLPVTLCFNQLR